MDIPSDWIGAKRASPLLLRTINLRFSVALSASWPSARPVIMSGVAGLWPKQPRYWEVHYYCAFSPMGCIMMGIQHKPCQRLLYEPDLLWQHLVLLVTNNKDPGGALGFFS